MSDDKNECIRRSRLYNLEPMAIGTPYIESLTSYICRLAEVHTVTVGTLVTQELAPILHKKYLLKDCLRGGSRFYKASGAINGLGICSEECITAIEALTGRDDLKSLTLAYWKNVLPSRELFRSNRAWCPLCFREWKASCLEIYEPLLWNIKAVKICPIHKTFLREKCPNLDCKNYNLVLTRKSRLGFCSKCGSWLGDVNETNTRPELSEGEFKRQNWVIEGVGKMLLYHQFHATTVSGGSLMKFIKSLVEITGGLKSLARKLHLPITTIRLWCEGKGIPRLEALLYLSFRTNISLVDIITSKYKDSDLTINVNSDINSCKKRESVRRTFNVEEVKGKLEESLRSSEYSPPSMREITRRLGYDKRLIYKHLPELCNSISKKYLVALSEQRLERIEKMGSEVKQATLYLFNEGLYPSQRRVEAYLGAQGILREQEIKKVWHEAMLLLNLRR